MPPPLPRILRALLILSAAAFLWCAIVAVTGGFQVQIAGVSISSRDYRDALAIGLVASLARVGLMWRTGEWRAVRNAWLTLSRAAGGVSRWWSALSGQLAAAAADARKREPWLTLAPAVAIAIAGTAFAIVQWLDNRPLWLDEEMILLNVRDRSWSALGGELWLGQSAPLGWLGVERAALIALGSGELALRLMPVLFGIGTIAVALWIGHRWMTMFGAAALVLLCAFAQHVSHYLFEAKHYSADTFWALLLPALAAWVVEGDRAEVRARRSLAWWIAAAAGQLMANGALLVAPGCALFLFASAWRRDGRRAALSVAAAGIVWLAAFGLHYQLALRFTHESEFLRAYWANEIPPASAGPVDRARWIYERFEPLARNPAGTAWWRSLWICAALGLAFGGRRATGMAFATVPLASFVLAGLRLVPLYDRFSLWIAPALYVGLALALDRALSVIRHADRQGRWSVAMAAMPVLLLGTAVSADIFTRGNIEIDARPSQHKHLLNDRVAVRWLMTQLRPGDAVMTTRLGWPAVWWYGGISIANADSEGLVRHPDGVALLEVEHAGPESECGDDRLREDLKGYRRVLVYVGFRDVPPGFDYLLLHTLDRMGAIAAFSRYSDLGLAAVFDLEGPAAADLTLHVVSPKTTQGPAPLDGCAGVRAARRW
jgi:hypothetical protein